MIEKHIDMLGKLGKDSVTGFEGVVTSISFDLYGCIQGVLTPPYSKKEGMKGGHWFDVTRIEILKKKQVMMPPDFSSGYIAEGMKGAAEKPVI